MPAILEMLPAFGWAIITLAAAMTRKRPLIVLSIGIFIVLAIMFPKKHHRNLPDVAMEDLSRQEAGRSPQHFRD